MEDENKGNAELSAKTTFMPDGSIDTKIGIFGTRDELALTIAMLTSELIDGGFPPDVIIASVTYGIENHEELLKDRNKKEES